MPQSNALSTYWQSIPPAALQLKRIGLVLGVPAPKPPVHTSAQTPQDAMREALAAGLPVSEGRPDDPLLDFLDL